ncbi:hypothetical protein ACTA71_012677 [Dictyostelium dimigraforme]
MNRLKTISKLRRELRNGSLKVEDLVFGSLKRARDFPRLNALVSLRCVKDLVEKVLDSQRRYNRGESRPLEGIPISIKDNFSSKDFNTTCGSNILREYRPDFNATVISLLEENGAIIIGKTNMDEFSMGSSSTTGSYGRVINPWSKVEDKEETAIIKDYKDSLKGLREKRKDKTVNQEELESIIRSKYSEYRNIRDHDELYVAGGSSGGSAASVASGSSVASIGSDTGGSIRQPASYCGVFGFKPSYGFISRFGLIPYASSLDTPGVITNCPEDAAELLKVLIQQDHTRDSTSIHYKRKLKKVDILNQFHNYIENKNIKDLVFGVPTEYIVEELNPEILSLWKEVVNKIEKRGGKVVQVSLPHTRYALPAYYLIASSEASSNLSKYDGIRYGYSHGRRKVGKKDKAGKKIRSFENDILESGIGFKEWCTQTRTEGFGEEVKKRLILGTMALSKASYDNYYVKAQKIRRLVSDDFKKVFDHDKVDILITPTVPSPAYGLNEQTNPLNVYMNDIMTIPSSLAGLPACSLPLKLSSSKLPLSIQLISKRGDDDKLLFAAHSIMNFADFKKFKELTPNYLKNDDEIK